MSAKALVYVEDTKVAVQDAPKPQLRDGYVLVKVRAVGLNPTDWKAINHGGVVGARVGCDYAGVVEEVGNNLGRPFKKGDRIAGIVHGS
jgi:NADPH:quinone reductase-like Zn-dependent oxidoreductase